MDTVFKDGTPCIPVKFAHRMHKLKRPLPHTSAFVCLQLSRDWQTTGQASWLGVGSGMNESTLIIKSNIEGLWHSEKCVHYLSAAPFPMIVYGPVCITCIHPMWPRYQNCFTAQLRVWALTKLLKCRGHSSSGVLGSLRAFTPPSRPELGRMICM